ncbi:hypothetical protein CSKR_109953, partial [Clonorchis sinensis]
ALFIRRNTAVSRKAAPVLRGSDMQNPVDHRPQCVAKHTKLLKDHIHPFQASVALPKWEVLTGKPIDQHYQDMLLRRRSRRWVFRSHRSSGNKFTCSDVKLRMSPGWAVEVVATQPNGSFCYRSRIMERFTVKITRRFPLFNFNNLRTVWLSYAFTKQGAFASLFVFQVGHSNDEFEKPVAFRSLPKLSIFAWCKPILGDLKATKLTNLWLS